MKSIRNSIALPALTLIVAMAACDLSVTNPGAVQDPFLDDPGAHPAVVAGAEYTLVQALNMAAFFGADAAKETTQGGRIHPIKLPPNPGQLDHTLTELPTNAWDRAHNARWVAEDGVRRLKETMGDAFNNSPLGAQILLYAGYANRLLGENMCEAVIDGSDVQPRNVHLTRAEAFFTEAMTVAAAANRAADLGMAARAGRASVRLWLANNAGASEDAAAVPLTFAYRAQFSTSTPQENHQNWMWYITSNTPYRAYSVWNTFYDSYFTQTGDPRVAWTKSATTPNSEFSNVPWYFQQKYTSATSPMNLSTGREMVLIRAEVALRAGNSFEALNLVNSIRTGVRNQAGTQIPLWTATSVTEAWTALKRERGIELWLETRRLGDLWRWVDGNTPGTMEDVTNRIRLCFPIATTELRTNPNLSLDHQSPRNPRYTASN